MRIDDFEQVDLNNSLSNPINFEQDMEEIDLLISDIKQSENTLRKRNNKSKYKHSDFRPKESSFKYITATGLDEIDDVVIEIETPEEYYLNKERRIVKYTDYIPLYLVNITVNMVLNVLIKLINIILYLIIKENKAKSL